MQTVFQWLVTYLLPQKSLTQLAGYLANHKGGALTTAVVRRFIRHYRVQMDDALAPDPASYETFNAFFTRAIKPGCRPIANAPWICPVDGALSQLGVREHGMAMAQQPAAGTERGAWGQWQRLLPWLRPALQPPQTGGRCSWTLR